MAKKIPSEMSNLKSKISNLQFLRVLMVEDSEDDALLEISELKKGGYNPVYERVETAAAMKKALKEKQWDIILCDYKLPKFNAPSAIAVLKETNIDIPLIIVSGTIGEETAVECMRLGAHDYIMKNNLSRLCPAIARELEEAASRSKRKQAEEALRESEALYRSQFEDHSAVKLLIDPDTGNIIDANEAAANFYGWSREKLKQMKIQEISTLSPEEVIKAMEMVRTQKRIHFEFRQRRADGSIRNVDVFSSKIKAKGKDILHSIIHDITERKQAEEALRESEERMKSIFRAAPTGIGVLTDRTFMDVNLRMCEMTGYTKEELIGASARVLYPTQDDFDYVGTEKYRQIAQKGTGSVETRWKKTDGTIIDVLLSSTPIDTSDLSRGVTFTALDITERKQTEDALRQSEEKYRNLVERANDGICFVQEGIIRYTNARLAQIVGYSVEELTGKPFTDFFTPEEVPKVLDRYKRRMAGKDVAPVYETALKHNDGSRVDIEINAGVITYEGKPADLALVRDITERKRAEEELRQSEEKYRNILENMQEGYFELDLAGNYTFANDAECRNIGYPKEEMVGMNFRQYTNEENAKILYQPYYELYRTGKSIEILEVESIRKDGTKVIYETSASLIRDAEGKPIGFRGISRDITERKQAEEKLRESEAQYRLLADNMKDQLWLMDLNLKPTYISPSVEKSRGYTFEEIAQLPLDKHLTATSLQSAMEFFSIEMPKALADPTYYMTRLLDLEFYCKDGSTLWLENTFSLIWDKNGKPLSLLGAGRDITERKRAEEKLRRSEEKYRSLVENAQEGIFQSTAEGHHISVNQAFASILGYESPEEVLATIADIPHQVYVHPDDRTKILQIIEKEGSVKGYEAEFYKKDGSKTWMSINMHAVRDEEGRLLYYQGIDQNITEKKKIKAERQENIERLRKSLEAMINAMAVTVETRDPYTAGHQRRVADLARAIAVEMNLKSEQIDSIRMASMIHDIGKIAVPAEILSKPTKLTDLEFDLIKTHSQSGYDILKDIEFPWPLADFVLQHHERMNGSGYPQGLKGDDILLEARIMAVADVVEAIASYRPYRPALGIDLALEEISGNKGILYDADAVDACLKLFQEKGYTLVLKK